MDPSQLPAASASMTRRGALALPALGGLVFLGLEAHANAEPAYPPGWPDFPRQPLPLAREFVTVAHGNLARVQAMLASTPGLVHAAWDWGFGDWETALGAAAHTGNRAIALTLLDHGARLDIFAAAMLGMLDAVKGMLDARPGIQRALGPHHITLLKHAKAGGEGAKSVVEYLTALGGSDESPAVLPIDRAQAAALEGAYETRVPASGAPSIGFRIFFEKERLNFQAGEAAPRVLYRVGEDEFFPSGVPSVRLKFSVRDGRAFGLRVMAPEPAMDAARVG